MRNHFRVPRGGCHADRWRRQKDHGMLVRGFPSRTVRCDAGVVFVGLQ